MKLGYKINKEENIRFQKNGFDSTYGELTISGVDTILKNINTNNKIFYDLGSGIGNVILNACKRFSHLKKCIGVEFSEERTEIANQQLRKNKRLKDKIQFIQDDLFNVSLRNADIIYISNLCFSDKINRRIGEKLDQEITTGTIVFSSKDIYLSIQHLKHEIKVSQTWDKQSVVYKYEIY
tara:strand:- start:37180 stop:37719 length:540 start_codon:yes stop_codon:yes gene_type:complete